MTDELSSEKSSCLQMVSFSRGELCKAAGAEVTVTYCIVRDIMINYYGLCFTSLIT